MGLLRQTPSRGEEGRGRGGAGADRARRPGRSGAPVRPADPPPTARAALRHFVVRPSWALLGLLAAAFAVASAVATAAGQVPPAPPYWVQCLPFAASLVLFGLPHGAVDHLAPSRLMGRRDWAGPALGVALLYGVLSGACLALWFAAPSLAFVLFVALTWLHWGQGDLYSLLAITRAAHLEDGVSRLLALLVRGGLPMLVPLLAFPEAYRGVARDLVGLFGGAGGDPAVGIGWAFRSAFRLWAGAAFAALVLLALARGRRRARSRGERRAWREDAAETALLAAYFALVPPLLAVGLYFCLWHSARFVARLMLLDAASPLRRGRLVPALAAFFKDAAPLTALALLLLAGLYFAVPGSSDGPAALVAPYLVLVSALTFPHAAVVLWMDREEGFLPAVRSGGPR